MITLQGMAEYKSFNVYCVVIFNMFNWIRDKKTRTIQSEHYDDPKLIALNRHNAITGEWHGSHSKKF